MSDECGKTSTKKKSGKIFIAVVKKSRPYRFIGSSKRTHNIEYVKKTKRRSSDKRIFVTEIDMAISGLQIISDKSVKEKYEIFLKERNIFSDK
jgi:hypothetical protein